MPGRPNASRFSIIAVDCGQSFAPLIFPNGCPETHNPNPILLHVG